MFLALQKTYKENGHNVYFSVLTKEEYFVLEKHVFNLEEKTFGKLDKGFGMFQDYYNSGNKNKYTDLAQTLGALPYQVKAQPFLEIRSAMMQMGLSDVYADSTLYGTVYALESSAGAGTRAIIEGSELPSDSLLFILQGKGKLLNFEMLGKKAYYYHLAPNPWM